MKPTRARLVAGVSLLCLLGACSTPQASLSPSSVTAGLQTAQAACTAAQPIVGAVPKAISTATPDVQATINQLLSYEQSVCATAAALNTAVAADTTGGTGTGAWITNIAGGLLQALPMLLALV